MTLKRLLACELAVTKTKDSGHGNSGHRELQGLGLRVSGAGFMVWVSRFQAHSTVVSTSSLGSKPCCLHPER